MVPVPTPAVPISREQRGGIPSFPIPDPNSLQPGAFSGNVLPGGGTDREDSRCPPALEGGGWEEAGGSLSPEVLPSLPRFFSRRSRFPRQQLALPHPHPSL